MIAVLKRKPSELKQTLGSLALFTDEGEKVFECKTLELPWLNNEKQKSCIPAKEYKITPRQSKKYGSHFLVNDVKNRDAILIHTGNYHTDILGCILVGSAHTDINGDGVKDVTNSKVTLAKILKLAPNGFRLQILWE